MNAPTTVARLLCNEPTARRLATFFSECLDPEDTACAAFEDFARQHGRDVKCFGTLGTMKLEHPAAAGARSAAT